MIILDCLRQLHARVLRIVRLVAMVRLAQRRKTNPMTVAGQPYFTKMSQAKESFVVSDLVNALDSSAQGTRATCPLRSSVIPLVGPVALRNARPRIGSKWRCRKSSAVEKRRRRIGLPCVANLFWARNRRR